MNRTLSYLLLSFMVVACSSAAEPSAGDVIDQADVAAQGNIQVALTDVFRAEEAYFAQNDTYTTDMAALGLNVSNVTIVRADAMGFCAEGRAEEGDPLFHIDNVDPRVLEGSC